jgi:hypothetical protein
VGHAKLETQTPSGETPQDITTTSTKIDTFNAKLVPSVDAVASIANSTIAFSEAGIWLVLVEHSVDVTPSSANASREWKMVFYNETDVVPIADAIVGIASIAKDQTASSISGSIIVAVPAALVGKELSIHMQSLSGSTIVVTEILASDFSVARLSHSEIVPSYVTSD